MNIIGTIKPLETLPSFVTPIFDKQGMLYYQNYQYFEDLMEIKVGFSPIVIEGEICDTFKMLSETVNSEVMQYAFQFEDGSVYLGENKDMEDFLYGKLESFKSDFFLYMEVCEFLGEYQLELDAINEYMKSNDSPSTSMWLSDKVDEINFIMRAIANGG